MRLGRLWSHLGDQHPAEARVLADSKLLPEAYIKEVISVNKETIEEEKVVAGDGQEPQMQVTVCNSPELRNRVSGYLNLNLQTL